IENKPGISNLMNIYSVLSGKSLAQIEEEYAGKGYGDFKKDLVEVTVNALAPIKERYEAIRHSDELIEILKDGAARANAIAQPVMQRVKDTFGLGL
ncbi:MAG: tryptophan--tRNA ligase, partial [Emergencia sp.]